MSIPFTSASLRYYEAARDPGINDDVTQGNERGNWWVNTSTNENFNCLDNTEGAAVWTVKPSFSSGVFTPVLEFGGASTGIVYGTQSGNYARVGSAVIINIFLSLSSKGSATGAATVSGIPFSNGSSHAAFTIYSQDVSLSLTYTTYGARIAPAQQFIRLFETGSLLSIQNLSDASFQNDSQIFISGSYFI